MTRRLSLSELAADGIQLRPAEAAAIVAELCRQHARGEIPGIASAGIIRITRDGGVITQGPMTSEDAGVARAGQLLDDLIPDAGAPSAYRASGGLRLVIARALGILDLPPYSSLDEFRAALVRFAGPDPAATIRGLFQRWEQPVTAPVPSGPPPMAAIDGPAASRDRSGPFPSALALVAAALLALGAIAIVVPSARQDRPARAAAREANRLDPQPPPPEPERLAPARESGTLAASAPRPAASASPPPAARPRARRAPPPRREAARPSSFFNRELFRIEIR